MGACLSSLQYMCFVDLAKAMAVFLMTFCGVLQAYGVPGLLLRSIGSLYNQSRYAFLAQR